jgi:hypothetical protein
MSRTRWDRSLTAATTALVVLSWAHIARADAVVDWHVIAADTICTASPPRPGPVGLLDQAIIQAAVYDAVQAIGGKYKPYHVQIPGASGSPEAAAAKAAHDVLVNIFPAQAASLDTAYREYLAKKGLTEDNPGVAVGQKAAAGMIALRADDGRVPNPLPPPFTGDKAAGVWRPTTSYQPPPPPSDAPMAAPWLGAAKGFTLQSGDQFRAKPPPALNSQQYATDYNEVKAVGAYSNSTRTPEQTDLANFYHSASLCVLFQRAFRDVAAAQVKNIDDSARLLALANFAMADAVITAWDSKKHYGLWRPVTAIQEGENDGNPATAGDPSWQPFLNTPPYPEYSSGANSVTGALTRTLMLFFGKDDVTFTVTSDHPKATQKTRTYSRFSDMASDMVNVRIYQGIHFRFGDEAGREEGTRVADWVFGHVAAAR